MNNDPINNDKDTCQQMVSIAELASNQHNDRRQITFRIAIGYTTLLALGFYLTIKTPRQEFLPPNFHIPWIISCTAYGFLDHSLKEDCATIQSH